jgi:hypothetical protein
VNPDLETVSRKAICQKKEKKEGIFMLEELDVLFVGIKDSPGAYGGLKRKENCYHFFVIKL